MDTQQIIWLVVAIVVVVVLLAALAAVMRRSRDRRRERDLEERRVQAQELRHEAVGKSSTVQNSELQAQEAEAEASIARTRAERAEVEAVDARRAADIEHARQEDVVREADRIDPHVDQAADDYRPSPPTAPADVTPTGAASGSADETPVTGTHRNDTPGSTTM